MLMIMFSMSVCTVWFSMSGDINVDDHDVCTVWFSMSGDIDVDDHDFCTV